MTERELSQALASGLAGQSLYRWGWAGLESATEPPSLPLVTLTRIAADVASISDMCLQAADLTGETTVETHAWDAGYEDARLLQDLVRSIIVPTGWRLQAEQDTYDGAFRAWRISAQWTNIGALVAA